MSKKKKDIIQEETLTELQAVESTENIETINAENLETINAENLETTEADKVQSEKSNDAKPKAKVGGLIAARIICFVLTFPVMILLGLLICLKVGEGAGFYSFWPYVGVILVALFALIFLIVALIVNRKSSKRKAMQKTISLMICCVCLTGGFGLLVNLALPDVIANATSSTLFVEDVFYDYEEQAEFNKGLVRQFVRLNLLNGNYDGELSYEELSKKTGNVYDDKTVNGYYTEYLALRGDVTNEIDALNAMDRELYDWIYDNYVLMDYDYAFKSTISSTQNRKAFCLALTKRYSAVYADLCEEGVRTSGLGAIATTGNDKMSWLFNYNYAGMNQNGYIALDDDCGIGYANGGRMTVPVVIRLILNERYSLNQPVYDAADKVVGYEGFLSYLYKPEIAAEYTGEFVDGKSVEMFQASDGGLYYAYEDGHVETSITWCVLDMLGEAMDIAEIDLAGMLGDLSSLIDVVLNDTNVAQIEDLLENRLGEVITVATNGQKLSLHLFMTDDGKMAISLVPATVEYGVMGYQWMTWMQSGNLLLTICGLMPMRNILVIFGAVSLVLIFVAGVLKEKIDKKREEA